jgi:DNA-binding MarR family transcriptional regulator
MRRPEPEREPGSAGERPAWVHSRHHSRDHRVAVRERAYALSGEEMATLRVVGTFRAVNQNDMPKARLDNLVRCGLIERRRVYAGRRKRPLKILVATKKGNKLLENERALDDLQRYWTGLVKPREAAHDAAIYAAFLDEAEEIEKAGGSIRRIVLDYELKSQINRELNRAEGPDQAARRLELSKDFDLPIIDEKLAFPDIRIEYLDAEGREEHRDIEIVTEHYRGRHLAGKRRSGFKLVQRDGPRKAVLDDHHMAVMP